MGVGDGGALLRPNTAMQEAVISGCGEGMRTGPKPHMEKALIIVWRTDTEAEAGTLGQHRLKRERMHPWTVAPTNHHGPTMFIFLISWPGDDIFNGRLDTDQGTH